MFYNNGPVHATLVQREFFEDHGASLPEAFKEKLKAVTRELSPVDAVVKGMETTYAAVRELELDPAARTAALHSLGTVATAVANGQFHGKGQRAWEIAAWAAQQIEPVEGVTVAEPDVDPGHTFIQPEPAMPEPVGTA